MESRPPVDPLKPAAATDVAFQAIAAVTAVFSTPAPEAQQAPEPAKAPPETKASPEPKPQPKAEPAAKAEQQPKAEPAQATPQPTPPAQQPAPVAKVAESAEKPKPAAQAKRLVLDRPVWPSRWWAEVSAHDFALAQGNGLAAETVAVLPVAAVEQHGPHLPLSVDASLLQGVVDRALQLLQTDVPVLVLPPQNIGLSVEHTHYAGTLTLSPATLIALWTELGACVARAGIKKLLLLNGHGGQVSVMDIVARELRIHHGLLVYSSSWFGLVDEAANAQFSAHEHRFGIHGGEIETSMMLHLAPESVHMERAQNFASTSEQRAKKYHLLGNGKSAKMGWAMEDYHPAGAVGNSAAATAERGAAMVAASARGLVQLLAEIHELPASTLGTAQPLAK